MLRGFISAVRTLTIIPIPGKDAVNMTTSLPWFPVVGALLGSILFGLWFALDAIPVSAWPMGEAFALLIAATILTRGIHLDGLADWADGFFSMTDKPRILEIMKDSRVGTFGVLALIMALGLKWIALVRLIENDAAIWIIAAFIVSRTVQVELAVALPYARATNGTGSPFVNGARARHKIIAWILAAALLAVISPLAPCILIPGYVGAKILGRLFMRRLGGVTGDLLGASSEIVETLSLTLLAFTVEYLSYLEGWEVISW